MVQNKGLIFASVPSGLPVAGKDIKIEDRPIDLETAAPEGGLVIKNNYVSFDPYQRGRMRDPSVKSYSPAFTLGKPVQNSTISTVVKSGTDKFKEGDLVQVSYAGFTEEYSTLEAEIVKNTVKKVDNKYNLDPKLFLGALGMPGLTAYSSFYEIGKPKKGETIFISAASGAVGALVGQLAKHEGLKVFGSVGDDDKLKYILDELKFDGGFNYKKEKPNDALKRLCPDGIDIYFENVGGEHLEAAISNFNVKGRVIACGMISQYNVKSPEDAYPIRNMMQVVAKRLVIRGFIVGDADMGPLYAKEHQENVQKWLHEGSFVAKMTVTKGIDNAAEGLLALFSGKNFGKAVLEICPLN